MSRATVSRIALYAGILLAGVWVLLEAILLQGAHD
jgi:hypothetical protein